MSALETVAKPLAAARFMAPVGPASASAAPSARSASQPAQSPASGSGGAAGERVEAAHRLGAVGPMPRGRAPRPVDHLVAVGGEDERPGMVWPAQDHQRAHGGPSLPAHGGALPGAAPYFGRPAAKAGSR